MPYRLELETRARRELLGLPREMQSQFVGVLDDLIRNPRPPGSKKLLAREGYRIRKGNYRVLYTIDDRAKLIRIFRIGHRRDIYR